ncbi:MAG: helicase [Deltaproteobacteria bacterium]|nr:helicase [Deltaproteobacteria bacterium]
MMGTNASTPAPSASSRGLPECGSFVRVRQRRWLVEQCEPFDTLTSLDLACVEDDAQGERLAVVWEAEPDARVLHDERTAKPARRPDPPERFAAYLHALRWGCVTSTDPTLFQAPLRAGIIPKTYQLEPLRKALALPRVNLFIADDVGLGKTIEAGLILHELLLRQRIHRAVIAAPPSVVLQWRDELRQRFGLDFTLYDRAFILECRRTRGFGVNPWKTGSFFVVSHALLRDEEHLTGLREWLGDFASGSMLILDEAHVAAPASASRYAVDTQITRAVRDLAQRFEHRLFLSATPHNGHSNSFSSLMHILDPQRFTRGIDISGPGQLAPVMVRRLKADVRKHASASLPDRKLVEVALDDTADTAPELRLAALLAAYDDALSARTEGANKSVRALVRISIEGLRKRLLSSTYAFQRTLRAHRKSTAKKILTALPPTPNDDDEASEQQELARLDAETARAAQAVEPFTDDAIRALLGEMADVSEAAADEPDARVRALVAWIREHQCPTLASRGHANPKGAPWLPRRVLIFTEFADTRAWLVDQLRAAIDGTDRDDDRIGSLHGSQDEDDREAVKQAFNASPAEHPLRILVATDAAREGINLQAACADLFHFDLPWNPARIEQRNGRIDRMLQPEREVRCHYFRYRNLPEDAVLARLATKSHAISSELGSFAPVVSDRILAVLSKGLSRRELAQRIAEIDAADEAPDATRAAIRRELDDAREKDLTQSLAVLEKLYDKARDHLDCHPQRLRQVVSEGLRLCGGDGLRPRTSPARSYDVPRMDERNANDPTWLRAMDALRPPRPPKMSEGEWRARFAPRPVRLEPVDTLVSDAVQLHLQHPLAQRAVSPFRSQAFTEEGLARVTVVVDRSSARKRVLVLGRLAVFGHGAARLHEEILGLAAYWSEGDDPTRLEPFVTEEANDKALEAFFRVLDDPEVPALDDEIVARLLRSAAADQRALETHLRRRALGRTEIARMKLQARGRAEGDAMRAVLLAQQESIRTALAGTQLSLGLEGPDLNEAQKQQWKDDREFLKRRLPQIDEELATEPERIRALYEDRQYHVEIVGIVYLWPATS